MKLSGTKRTKRDLAFHENKPSNAEGNEREVTIESRLGRLEISVLNDQIQVEIVNPGLSRSNANRMADESEIVPINLSAKNMKEELWKFNACFEVNKMANGLCDLPKKELGGPWKMNASVEVIILLEDAHWDAAEDKYDTLTMEKKILQAKKATGCDCFMSQQDFRKAVWQPGTCFKIYYEDLINKAAKCDFLDRSQNGEQEHDNYVASPRELAHGATGTPEGNNVGSRCHEMLSI